MRISRALTVFVLLSLVSLFADMCYEGARSVAGAYMRYLEAPAIIAGLLGLGEVLSYAMRAVSGLFVSIKYSLKLLWALIIGGYIVNLMAVPALALTGNWEYAFVLLLAERIGKGLRAPPRDIVLSDVTSTIGRGKGFGLHELMDQVGAVAGPVFVAWSLGRNGYRSSFAWLSLPALTAILLILAAAVLHYGVRGGKVGRWGGFPRKASFKFYLLATFFISAGFIHWFLVGYRLLGETGVSGREIALLYTMAMLVDALFAFPLGAIYDKIGIKLLILSPLLAASSTIMLLYSEGWLALAVASGLWGLFMSYIEVVFKASTAELAGGRLAGGFGYYYIIQALGWGVGSTVMGFLYAFHPSLNVYYVLAAESLGIFLLYRAIRS